MTAALLALTACGSQKAKERVPVLLFAGGGTSTNDVAAVENILDARHLAYEVVSTGQLNAMSVAQLSAYHLLLIPGGNFIAMSDSLTRTTTTNIRDAVQGGLNYLGICAGAFMAADAPYNSLRLASGVKFGFYSAERNGVRKAIVNIASAGSPPIEQYWEDGPELTGWGTVVAKYPDGMPAIVEGTSGKGWVILSGVHPEAPAWWWRGMVFSSSASAANAYAGRLVDAALQRTQLEHY